MDAAAVARLTKSADGGFTILRAIFGIGVKAGRLMKLIEDLKKQVYIYLALTLQRNKSLLESLQYCEKGMSEKVSLILWQVLVSKVFKVFT